MIKMREPPPPPAFTMSPVEMDRYPAREHHRFLTRPLQLSTFLMLARDEAEHTRRPLSMFPIYHNLKACCFIVSCAHITGCILKLGLAVLPGRTVDDQRQLRRFGLLVLLAVLFIPLGYIVREIDRENAVNDLQIIALFVVEAVRLFPWI
jgi:hypothetical protein